MKNISSFLVFLVMIPYGTWGSDTLTIKSKIEKVTVFFSGAEVFGSSSVNLKPGLHHLIISDLPASADPQSIKVEGNAAIIIHSVNHRMETNFPQEDDAFKAINANIESISRSMADLSSQFKVFETERAILLDNSKLSNGEQSLSVAQIREAANFYRSRLLEIEGKKKAIRRDMEQKDEELKALKEKLNIYFQKNAQNQLTVLIKIENAAAYQGALQFSYFTKLAGWTPQYDIRIKDLSSPLSLNYKGAVYQTTGVDWKNVKLTLSAENPLQSRISPTLQPWRLPNPEQASSYQEPKQAARLEGRVQNKDGEKISFAQIKIFRNSQLMYITNSDKDGTFNIKPMDPGGYQIRAEHYSYQANALNINVTAPSTSTLITLNEPVSQYVEEVNKEMTPTNLTSNESRYLSAQSINRIDVKRLESADLAVSKRVTIPLMAQSAKGDISSLQYIINKPQLIPSNGLDYTINLQEVQIPAAYVYEVVPKLDPRAFLMAEIEDWEDLRLLPGAARLYLRGSYVGISKIDPNTIGDNLRLSLGNDKGLNIERKLNKQLQEEGLFGGKISRTMAWEIVVRNLKDETVTVMVKDQIPLSDKTYIEIETLETSTANHNTRNGELIWMVKLDARASETLNFSYEVRYPEEVSLSRF